MPVLEKALLAQDAEQAIDDLNAGARSVIERFEENVPAALTGGFAAVQVVVTNWDTLVKQALLGAADLFPGALTQQADFVEVHGRRVDWLIPALRASVAEAPFSRFVGTYGIGVGMALSCLAEVRDAIPDLKPLIAPRGDLPDLPPDTDVLRFRRLVDLVVRGLSPPLERVQEALGLSAPELGHLFGVSRQAIDQWKDRGVPSERLRKLADLIAVVDLLDRKTKPGRLPLVVRRPAEAFEGLTFLDMVASDRHQELVERVKRALDWSTTA